MAGKKPIAISDHALMVGMGVVTQLDDEGIILLPNVTMSGDAMLNGIEYCKTKTTEVPENKVRLSAMLQKAMSTTSERTLLRPSLRAAGYDVMTLVEMSL